MVCVCVCQCLCVCVCVCEREKRERERERLERERYASLEWLRRPFRPSCKYNQRTPVHAIRAGLVTDRQCRTFPCSISIGSVVRFHVVLVLAVSYVSMEY